MERQYKILEPSFGISKKLVLTCILALCFFIITTALFVGFNKEGDITVLQYPWGKARIVSSPGFYFKLYSKTIVYKKTGTFTLTVPVRFNDGFADSIKTETMYTLPALTDEQTLKVHYAYRSQENLVESLYKPVTRHVMSLAAVSMSSEESRSQDFKEKFEKLVQEQIMAYDVGAIRVKIIG